MPVIEKVPAKVLPTSFVPSGGRPYRVKDGDSWWTVAKTVGVPPLDLVHFNFGTRQPAEINWYLGHRVGCRKTTADGKNYVFSSTASPGVIYLPPASSTTPPSPPLRTTPVLADAGPYEKLGIRIDGSDEYRGQVKAVLDWIARCDTGRALLRGIGSTGKKMVISPFSTGAQACTEANRNAYASPDDMQAATPKDEFYFKNDDPNTSRDERFDPVMDSSLGNDLRGLLGLPQEPMLGTGKGSDVTLSFTPGMWGYGNICSASVGPGSSPTQVLFHEMAHGYRQMRGHLFRLATLGTSRPYDNREEFFAIVLSNVFIADPTNPVVNRTLRSDHWGFSPLPAAQSTSRGFLAFQPNFVKLKQQAAEEPNLVADLKKVGGPFNPFKAF